MLEIVAAKTQPMSRVKSLFLLIFDYCGERGSVCGENKKLFNIKWTLVLYDAFLYFSFIYLMFVLNKALKNMQIINVFINSLRRLFNCIFVQIFR